jgi:hypothetical protein
VDACLNELTTHRNAALAHLATLQGTEPASMVVAGVTLANTGERRSRDLDVLKRYNSGDGFFTDDSGDDGTEWDLRSGITLRHPQTAAPWRTQPGSNDANDWDYVEKVLHEVSN